MFAASPFVTVRVYTVVWSWTPRSNLLSGLGSALLTVSAEIVVDTELGFDGNTAGFVIGAPVLSKSGSTRGSVLA